MTKDEEKGYIERVLAGDESAYEPLVTENQTKVYRLALRILKNEADAEDAAQEAFLKAYTSLADFLLNRPVLGPVLAGVVGLIPNCAASVTITQLYISGVISLGAMMSGLLVGAGVGLLVLFRVNPDKKENLKIVGILYVIGVLAGIVINWL